MTQLKKKSKKLSRLICFPPVPDAVLELWLTEVSVYFEKTQLLNWNFFSASILSTCNKSTNLVNTFFWKLETCTYVLNKFQYDLTTHVWSVVGQQLLSSYSSTGFKQGICEICGLTASTQDRCAKSSSSKFALFHKVIEVLTSVSHNLGTTKGTDLFLRYYEQKNKSFRMVHYWALL